MFKQDKVECFIQGVKFAGDEKEKTIEFLVYVTPLTLALAEEVSAKLADRLFRNGEPAQEMSRAAFNLDGMCVQSVVWFPVKDPALDFSAVLTENVKCFGLVAMRLFPEKPEFSLTFKANVPMDKNSLEIASRYYKKKVCLSFKAMQGELGFEPTHAVAGHPLCQECNLLAVYIDEQQQTWCEVDKVLGVGAIKELKIDAVPPQEQAAAAAGDAGKAKRGGKRK